ncbi:hypothetical protein J0H58_16810 [bacterium]|nr:hypothetical protein [bacterium]
MADEDYALNVCQGRSRLVLDAPLLVAGEIDRVVSLLSGMPEAKRVKVQRPGE